MDASCAGISCYGGNFQDKSLGQGMETGSFPKVGCGSALAQPKGSQRALNPESARHVRTRACDGGKVHQCQAGISDEWAVAEAGGIYGRGKLCSGDLPAC